MVISGVTNLMAGATQVVRAYAGTTEVWSPVSRGYIYYKSTNNSVVTPNVSGFGANIVSNTYSGGQGVITFDGAVTAIPAYAFSGITNLATISIPNTVTSISAQAFSGCTSLTEFVMPDSVTYCGTSNFRNCYSLKSVSLSSGLTSIPNYSFTDCTVLTSVTVPSSITTVGTAAFRNCSDLPSITLPATLTNIGQSAFSGCTGLCDITFLGTKSQWNSVTKDTNWNLYVPSYGVYCSDGYDPWVTNSSKKLYYTTTSKSTITPRNITAFNDTYSNSITSNSYNIRGTLEFYYDVTTIPVNAFSGMTSLQSICIDNEGAKIRDYAFKDCTNLITIAYLGTKSNWNNKTKGTDWYLNTKATVVHCTDGDVSI